MVRFPLHRFNFFFSVFPLVNFLLDFLECFSDSGTLGDFCQWLIVFRPLSEPANEQVCQLQWVLHPPEHEALPRDAEVASVALGALVLRLALLHEVSVLCEVSLEGLACLVRVVANLGQLADRR